jgi:molybdenum cofactor synthesis domain-containing protein
MRAGVLTISNKGFKKEREDKSGPVVCDILSGIGTVIENYEIVPDEKEAITAKLLQYADELNLDLVVTTGGTGVSPADITPEATREVIDKEIPGIAEAMRMESLKITPHAVISRGIAYKPAGQSQSCIRKLENGSESNTTCSFKDQR